LSLGTKSGEIGAEQVKEDFLALSEMARNEIASRLNLVPEVVEALCEGRLTDCEV